MYCMEEKKGVCALGSLPSEPWSGLFPSPLVSLCRKIVSKQVSYIVLCSDIPMAQYIINMNASLPASDKFIIHILDNTHMFVQPHVEQMIRSQIAKFREDNTYVKPT
ncbi:general transcription and DNA repair factor IIH subunit TFB5 isoform X1 [Abrus precatorius]|uniref:General transcription and DNA repair factor IIH subunit TFB5 n=1 Tax=Abrus precatorius TaxID=3816 RepID=A0A8B8KD52_ABRPR|nr:general transcription and DNA repair factor IIH subunit TFB5 isoform X1 [Abrus precatorius]